MARLWAVVGLITLAVTFVDAKTYKVTPDGSPSLQDIMAIAKAGDVVELGDGVYSGGIKSSTSGTESRPITITGSREAVVSGTNPDDDRVITIKHSYIHLQGFTVDGKMDSRDSLEFYADKCIYVHGQEKPRTINYMGHEFLSTINGLVLSNLSIKNCQGECVRMRYFVTHADIQDNDVQNCGVDDFIFNPGKGKNGEGFYIGTSSEQWEDGKNPDSRPDGSSFNLVRNNVILTNGNECVEVKEGTEHNLIEGNTCGGQLDENSGCFGSRGDLSIFRFNKGDGCDGAGVRVGGHLGYGINNKVYENSFTKMGAGSVKIMAEPQAEICGNMCSNGDCTVVGAVEYGADWDQPCSSNIGLDLMPYGGAGEGGGGGGGIPRNDDIAIPVDDDSTTVPGNDDSKVIPEDDDNGTTVTTDDEERGPADDDHSKLPCDNDTITPGNDDMTMPGDDDNTKIVDDDNSMKGDDDQSMVIPVDDDQTIGHGDDDKTIPGDNDELTPEDDDVNTMTGDDEITISPWDDDSSGTSENGNDLVFPASCIPVEIESSFLTEGHTTLPNYPATHLIDGDLSTTWSAEGYAARVRVELEEKMSLAGVFIAFPETSKKPQLFEIKGDDHKVLVSMREGSSKYGLQFFSFNGIVETSTINLFGFGDSGDAMISFSALELCGVTITAAGNNDDSTGDHKRSLRGYQSHISLPSDKRFRTQPWIPE